MEPPEDDDRAVYMISVAAELAGVHPQTLRIYERKGLLRPQRTEGNTRRYSQSDIDRLLTIQGLTQEGVNLAGVKRIIELRLEIEKLSARIADLAAQLEHRRAIAMPGGRIGDLVLQRNLLKPPWQQARQSPQPASWQEDPTE